MKTTSLNSLILSTLVGFSSIAILLDHWSDRIDLIRDLGSTGAWLNAVPFLFIVPVLIFAEQLLTVRIPILQEVEQFSRSIFKPYNPSWLQIIALSLAAGIGEELLFRGAVQPILGIFLSSLIFAGLHTGFRTKPKVLSYILVLVYLLSVFLGVVYKFMGLPATIVIHTLWDFLNLWIIVKRPRTSVSAGDFSRSQPDKDNARDHQQQDIIDY